MVTQTLEQLIAEESAATAFPAAAAMVEHLRATYGTGTRAVVFYGSSLRLGTDDNLMLDFYVLVDKLTAALGNPISAAFGAILPPNVYYHECEFEGRTVRAKVAVMTLDAFTRGTAETTLAPALWARFAQPAAIVYAKDGLAQATVTRARERAVRTLLEKTRPLIVGPCTIRDLWVRAFQETYSTELRPEKNTKAEDLVAMQEERFTKIGYAAMDSLRIELGLENALNYRAIWAWHFRRWWGRLLNVLRLIKAAFTFSGGLNYAAWKIERHSGIRIELTGRDRAHPILTGIRLFFRIKRKGGLN